MMNQLGVNKEHLQDLLESAQDLFQVAHKHVVDQIVKRDGCFSPFGLAVSADREYVVAGI